MRWLHQLRRMHHSRTGQAVFHEFEKRSHHFMKIIPYEQAQLNAFASAKDPLHATKKGAGPNAAAGMDTCCSTATASPSSAKVAAAIRTSPSRR